MHHTVIAYPCVDCMVSSLPSLPSFVGISPSLVSDDKDAHEGQYLTRLPGTHGLDLAPHNPDLLLGSPDNALGLTSPFNVALSRNRDDSVM